MVVREMVVWGMGRVPRVGKSLLHLCTVPAHSIQCAVWLCGLLWCGVVCGGVGYGGVWVWWCGRGGVLWWCGMLGLSMVM